MSPLPHFVRRLPYIFYVLAVVLGAWRYWNEWIVASESFKYADATGMNYSSMATMSRSSALYWGFADAAYLVANGAIIHVLIAIFDKVKGPAE